MKYVHTNIITDDWQALSYFYVQVFECEIVPPQRRQSGEWLSKGTGVPNAQLEGVHLRLPGYAHDGPTLEIYQYSQNMENQPAYANRKGYGHIAFEVKDVRQILDKMIDHGGRPVGKVITHQIEGKGELVFTYAKDPDGNIIELQHWT